MCCQALPTKATNNPSLFSLSLPAYSATSKDNASYPSPKPPDPLPYPIFVPCPPPSTVLYYNPSVFHPTGGGAT